MNRVLHITHTDIRYDSRILKELQSLVNSGERVCGLGVLEASTIKACENNLDLQVIKISSRSIKFLPRILKHIFCVIELVLKMLPAVLNLRPEILHVHDVIVLPVAVLSKIFIKTKIIYDAHELESDRNGITRLAGFFTKKIEKLSWKYIDYFVVVSNSIDNWYQLQMGQKKSSIIFNSPFYRDEIKPYDYNYLRTKFNIPDKSKIFIYIGIITAGRGIELMLKAFSEQIHDSHIVFLGYGDMTDKVIKASREKNNIHYHIQVSHEQVVPIASSADYGLCFVQNASLSDYYCLPNKLFEYAFAGLPVFASNFPDIQEIVNKYGLGECFAPSYEEIVAKIKEIETKNTNRVDLSKIKDLSWESQEKKLLQVYKNIRNL